MFISSDYHEAYQQAQADANTFCRPMALERANEYGKIVFRVKMLPIKPEQRFGWGSFSVRLSIQTEKPSMWTTQDLCEYFARYDKDC